MSSFQHRVRQLGAWNARLWRHSKLLWALGLGFLVCICCFGISILYSLTPDYRNRASATVAAFRQTQDSASHKQTQVVGTATQSSARTASIPPTPIRTNTAIPSPAPSTSLPPTPSVTLAPTHTPTLPSISRAKGLGISRAQLQTLYEAFDFSFEQGTPIDGADNFTAQNANVVLQLVGPADDLTQVSLVAVSEKGESLNNAKAAVYMLLLLRAMQPDWGEQGDAWLTDASKRAGTDETVAITRNHTLIRVSVAPVIGTVILTFEPSP